MGLNVDPSLPNHLKSDGTSIFANGGYGTGYWDVGTFSATEVYVTVGGTQSFNLYWRVNSPGTGWTGYFIRFGIGSTDVAWHTESSYLKDTFLGAALSSGDQVGISSVGSTHTLYVNGTSVDTWTEASYSSGYIGLEVDASSSPGATNFGGGTPVAAGGHILTEGGDYIDTEGGDRLVTENFTIAYTLSATAGSVAVTGASATPNVGITATAGSAAINGTAATFAIHRTLSATAGSVTVTGATATPNVGITATAGSVTINGSPVTPAPKITATAGSVAATGFQATLAVHRVFSALPGTFTITGDNATPNVAITASAGSVAINGTAATPAVAITATAGAVVITGSPVTFSGLHAYTLNATAASVAVSGNAATLTKQTAGGGGATPTDGGAVEQQRISQYVSRLRAEDDLVTVLAGL